VFSLVVCIPTSIVDFILCAETYEWRVVVVFLLCFVVIIFCGCCEVVATLNIFQERQKKRKKEEEKNEQDVPVPVPVRFEKQSYLLTYSLTAKRGSRCE
jgi:uncharacterized SAM-binding protein YcdF (DUF218 family)